MSLGEHTRNGHGDGEARADATVEQALTAFLDAYLRLDRDQVRAFFADEATVFHPWGGSRQTEFWNATFDEWCPTHSGPPYLDIQPREITVQSLGDVAVMTFHFRRDPALLGRRTFVWSKTPFGWKIIHLHASNLPTAEAPTPVSSGCGAHIATLLSDAPALPLVHPEWHAPAAGVSCARS